MKNSVFKGSLFILLGASCYGMLGTYVKMAYQAGYTIAEVTLVQFLLGFFALFILNVFHRDKPKKERELFTIRSRMALVLSGSSLGLTSIFYYMALKYIPVSVAIVLLMQAVWMGILLEVIMYKRPAGLRKLFSALVVLIGSVLATNLLGQSIVVNWTGISFGILAALCYTATMYSTKNIEPHLPANKRSLYMISGGLLVILIVFHSAVNSTFSYELFYSWGLVVALLGTVLPPLLFTSGMPLTGVGLGAILSSIEMPVAVISAHFLLEERVDPIQWIGVTLILVSVAAMNFRQKNIFYN